MPLIAYLDEAGDPTLEIVDKQFPIFSLALIVCDTDKYIKNVVPAVYRLKMETWGYEGIILHSRDIRKGQGDFAFLTRASTREPFYEKINKLVCDAEVTVLAVAVRKEQHLATHGERARDPYDLALRFAFERLLLLLEDAAQEEITVVAEARGRTEDAALRRHLRQLLQRGTGNITADRFQRRRFHIRCLPKSMNIIGTQLADLIAYPVARHALHPERFNPSFNVLESKLCRRDGERIGLAIYPPHA